MTDERKIQLRALCNAAKTGPWHVFHMSGEISVLGLDSMGVVPSLPDADPYTEARVVGNLYFIAEARTAVPELLDEVERLEVDNAALRAKLESARNELKDDRLLMSEWIAEMAGSYVDQRLISPIIERADEIERLLQTHEH